MVHNDKWPTIVAALPVIMLALLYSVPLTGTVRAGPALVFDLETSRIVHGENEDTPWYPASLTKLMTAYMVFDALKRDAITGEAELVISPLANAQPKMRVGLGAGKRITVKEALAGLIIKSANDLAYALAETVSGTEDEFVAEMNQMAVKLGMVRTRFANSNGLPKEGQTTTARDMAILARALLRDFPQWKYLYAEAEAQVGNRTVRTHNDVLKNFDGADGMKTGFTCGAGYNVVASATRNGRKIIAVVLGEKSNRARTTRAEELLERAFASSRPTAEAAVIDAPTFNGEMLVDVALIATPDRAANFLKMRHCWPEPNASETGSTVAATLDADTVGAASTAVRASALAGVDPKVSQVVPPAPRVQPSHAKLQQVETKTVATSKSASQPAKSRASVEAKTTAPDKNKTPKAPNTR